MPMLIRARPTEERTMPKPIRLLAAAVLAGAAAPAAADPIAFLVAEHPGAEIYDDSYVLVLEKSTDIAHARALIASKRAIAVV